VDLGTGVESCTRVVIHTYRVRRRLGLPSGRENWEGIKSIPKNKKSVEKQQCPADDDRDEWKRALDGGRRKSLVL